MHDNPTTVYRRRPGDVLAAVEAGLRGLGVDHLYLRADPQIGVLSIAPGLTVWCDGCTLTWRSGREQVKWPITDAEGAARQLADLAKAAAS